MNRPFPTRESLVMVVGLTCLPRPAVAQLKPTLTVVLQVPDHGRVPLDIVTRAKPEVERIYRDAGVTVIWNDASAGASQANPSQSPETSDRAFALVVLPREITDRLTVAKGALGGAAGSPEERGRMAYVFYNRVERIARTHLHTARLRGNHDIDTVIVLAHAMTHEIGHLLLPYGHSADGLMRAECNGADLRRAVRGQLNFTAQQAESIRAKLLSQPGSESRRLELLRFAPPMEGTIPAPRRGRTMQESKREGVTVIKGIKRR
jgi:hypothetical protein